ncbi:MAG TPA: GAF domain-containing protein, partial [Pseudonocardia sp.]|nr:GAF domain-containing protein [Pseudonocardia sp.]
MHADQREPVSYREGGVERTRAETVAGAGRDVTGELTFPDVPRLELDTLLAQLIDRAQEVMSTQGRLRGLLRATQMITADLALPVVLHQIAVAARDLMGARYAALGVIAPDGHLSEFVHVGMPDELVAQIGQLPQGKGLLGALIDDPAPIRLDSLGQDERSSGFPPGHPPMDSFLGVPVRVKEEVFGNLYLAESTSGTFTAEDEELATALAASAGVVIANARLYEAARDRHKWLQASAMITRQLLSPDPEGTGRPLQLIAEQCRDIAGADLVTVVLPTEGAVSGPPDLRVEIAVGTGGEMERLVGRSLSLDSSLAGRVFTSGQPLRMANPYELVVTPALSDVIDVGPVLVVPLKGSQRMHGVLTVARLRGCAAFSAED